MARRDKRGESLAKKFNKIVEKLASEHNIIISPLPLDKLDTILEDDRFLDLERVQARERWAMDSNVRKGCDMMLQRDRAQEEINLLESAIQRFIQINATTLRHIQSAMTSYSTDTIIYAQLRLEADKSVASLRSLREHFSKLWTTGQRLRKVHTATQQKLWIEAYGKTIKPTLEGFSLSLRSC
jgi:hypothetical protein